MRGRTPSMAYWTWLLSWAMASYGLSFSALCNDNSKSGCNWLNEYTTGSNQQRDTLKDLMTLLDDRALNPNQLRPQVIAYKTSAPSYGYSHPHNDGYNEQLDGPTQQQLQLPFSSSWKSQYDTSDSGSNAEMEDDVPVMWDGYKPLVSPEIRPYDWLNIDTKRTRNAFSSWGGKRSPASEPQMQFDDSHNAKPITVRANPGFFVWGGKRDRPFYNWHGKRSLPEGMETHATMTTSKGRNSDENSEHHLVIKRAVSEPGTGNRGLPQPSMVDTIQWDQNPTMKRLNLDDAVKLRQLLEEFVEWSSKQPGQKKASWYGKMLNVRTLHNPDTVTRRAGSFYPWGGKRSSQQKHN